MSSVNRDYREWESFAKKLAAKYVTAGIEQEDLEQEALLTLLEELPKYSPSIGVSLRVFLGRGIRNKLASLYRKTLNLVQIEQYWLVEHISGSRDMHVKAKSKSEAEAVVVARPGEYVNIQNVKTLAALGPSLDEEADDEQDATLHEVFGENPLQELQLIANEGESNVRKANRNGNELAEIFRLRNEGHTFDQIGEQLNKDGDAVRKAFSRAQKRLNRNKAEIGRAHV